MIKESNNLPEHDNNYQVYLPNNLHSPLHLLCGSIHPSIKKEFKEAVDVPIVASMQNITGAETSAISHKPNSL